MFFFYKHKNTYLRITVSTSTLRLRGVKKCFRPVLASLNRSLYTCIATNAMFAESAVLYRVYIRSPICCSSSTCFARLHLAIFYARAPLRAVRRINGCLDVLLASKVFTTCSTRMLPKINHIYSCTRIDQVELTRNC